MDTVGKKDTSALADYLQKHKGDIIRDTRINFHNKSPDAYFSRIARYVHSVNPYIFYHDWPQMTPIHHGIVGQIRALNLNVPSDFK